MTEPTAEPEPAVRNYLVLCLAAQAVIVLVLLRHGLRGFSLLIPFIGLAGLTVRWRMAPLFTLITLAGVLYWDGGRGRGFPRNRESAEFNLQDWMLCGATLAYVASHYRFLALTTSVFPSNHRRWERGARDETGNEPRAAGVVSASEVGWLVLSLPIWAYLGQLCWGALPGRPPPGVELRPSAWRGAVLLWILLGSGLLLTALLAYLRLRRMQYSQAKLYLQDTLWLESYREQRRLNRWLAWMRRRHPDKEQP